MTKAYIYAPASHIMLGMLKDFYGSTVMVHLFARDPELNKVREFVRNSELSLSEQKSGELRTSYARNTIYHVPDSNSVYFNSNFTDFEIIGTVDGPDGLEIYCDFCEAFDLTEVERILESDGWSQQNLP